MRQSSSVSSNIIQETRDYISERLFYRAQRSELELLSHLDSALQMGNLAVVNYLLKSRGAQISIH